MFCFSTLSSQETNSITAIVCPGSQMSEPFSMRALDDAPPGSHDIVVDLYPGAKIRNSCSKQQSFQVIVSQSVISSVSIRGGGGVRLTRGGKSSQAVQFEVDNEVAGGYIEITPVSNGLTFNPKTVRVERGSTYSSVLYISANSDAKGESVVPEFSVHKSPENNNLISGLKFGPWLTHSFQSAITVDSLPISKLTCIPRVLNGREAYLQFQTNNDAIGGPLEVRVELSGAPLTLTPLTAVINPSHAISTPIHLRVEEESITDLPWLSWLQQLSQQKQIVTRSQATVLSFVTL
eukprot:Lithocolla_globosa_v1_NODE_580_length_3691_cov_16.982398.p2 type:complete len:292 gc:universal NODE_580_length_3691_cov_16.982398:662-1537(+)